MSWNPPPNPPQPHPPHPPQPPHFAAWGGPPPGSPFWDWVNSFDANGQHTGHGVDHTGGFPNGFPFAASGHGFGGPPWVRNGWGGHGGGRHGPSGQRGRHHHGDGHGSGNDEDLNDVTVAATTEAEMEIEREKDRGQKADSPATMHDAPNNGADHPDPPEEVPPTSPHRHPGGCRGRRWGGGPFGRRGRGGSRGHHHGPPFGGPPFGPPPFAASSSGGPFDFNNMLNALGDHPFARRIRSYVEQIRNMQTQNRGHGGADEDDGSFTPPVDLFDTPNNWTVHVAVPGARKEDIGVSWDVDRATLTVAGVVHRPGDEEFISSLISGERRVGMFERHIVLPPPPSCATAENEGEEKEEVDGDNITAKMEDGILVVVVPKVEKEWTEIKKVDIL